MKHYLMAPAEPNLQDNSTHTHGYSKYTPMVFHSVSKISFAAKATATKQEQAKKHKMRQRAQDVPCLLRNLALPWGIVSHLSPHTLSALTLSLQSC